ncbi:hypothetical protein NDU88_003386 [Pleurodeles waltl]|uniref:Uncharacterized protein n=1 Tax=Pleurodeles waltl TaxID=8319 RepID=A0AAV7Q9I1_PLEWA|nr:hypothetical protein NDU88_003386 [Pleurodeles waltl]
MGPKYLGGMLLQEGKSTFPFQQEFFNISLTKSGQVRPNARQSTSTTRKGPIAVKPETIQIDEDKELHVINLIDSREIERSEIHAAPFVTVKTENPPKVAIGGNPPISAEDEDGIKSASKTSLTVKPEIIPVSEEPNEPSIIIFEDTVEEVRLDRGKFHRVLNCAEEREQPEHSLAIE